MLTELVICQKMRQLQRNQQRRERRLMKGPEKQVQPKHPRRKLTKNLISQ